MNIELKRLDGYLQNATLVWLLIIFVPKLYIHYTDTYNIILTVILLLLMITRGYVHYKLTNSFSVFYTLLAAPGGMALMYLYFTYWK